MIEINELVVKTTCAGALGIVVAQLFRTGIHRLMRPHRVSEVGLLFKLHGFIHSAISAFILIVSGYEKIILLLAGMRGTFFFFTFVLCILFSRIFSSSAPSPCFPLEQNWRKIRQSGILFENNNQSKGSVWNVTSLIRMLMTYIRLGIPHILGQCFGLFVAIKWLKYFWNGWFTSDHVTNLPFLDECIDCLNTRVFTAFIIETTIAFMFLISFKFVDDLYLSHDGANKLMNTFLAKNCMKSAIVIVSMYFFIDVTGSFANPFQALAMQRHCMNDVTSIMNILFVYVIGPFVGTITYLCLRHGGSDVKAKNSV